MQKAQINADYFCSSGIRMQSLSSIIINHKLSGTTAHCNEFLSTQFVANRFDCVIVCICCDAIHAIAEYIPSCQRSLVEIPQV